VSIVEQEEEKEEKRSGEYAKRLRELSYEGYAGVEERTEWAEGSV